MSRASLASLCGPWLGCGQIGRDCVAAAASFADLTGFIGATAVMHRDLRTGGGEYQRAGAADAASSFADLYGTAFHPVSEGATSWINVKDQENYALA
jgi:hypothetical protein